MFFFSRPALKINARGGRETEKLLIVPSKRVARGRSIGRADACTFWRPAPGTESLCR